MVSQPEAGSRFGGTIARCWLLAAAVCAAPPCWPQPAADASVRPARFTVPPTLDCRLEDEAWAAAASLGPFHQTHPGDNTRPTRATEVRLGYTAHALYLAIRAEDDPGLVRATLAKRDAILDDDAIALYLDTFHDQRRAYVVIVNPLGVQQDGVLVEGSEPDYSPDLVFQSKGCLTGAGYAIEVAIPFESIRYQAGAGELWGLHVLRHVKHLDEENSWMPLRRDRVGVEKTSTEEVRARFLSQAGLVAGLEGIQRSPVLELIPVATLSRAGHRLTAPDGSSAFVDDATELDPGLTAQLNVTSSLALNLALNPDFAEVEADQPQITANQRFPLLFEEKRPFFLEGVEMFRTPLRAFYSRAIVDPVAAAKVTGRVGRSSVGMLIAADGALGHFTPEERRDPGLAAAVARFDGEKAYVGAVRLRRDIGAQSGIGLLATSHDFAGRNSRLIGLDARLGLGQHASWTGQLIAATSRLPALEAAPADGPLRRKRGIAYFTELAHTAPRFSLQVAGEGYSRDYRALLGYTQRTDTYRWSAVLRYNAPPGGTGPLVSWSALSTGLVQSDWQGRMQYAYLYPRLALTLKRQSVLNLSAYRDYLRVFEEEFGPARTPTQPGAFAGPDAERSTTYHGFTVDAGTAPSQRLSVRGSYDRAWNVMDYDLGAGPRFPRVSPAALRDPAAPLDPGPGGSRYMAATLVLQPSDALRLSAAYERTSLTRNDTGLTAFDQQLTSLRIQYAFSRSTSLRARVDHDSLERRLFHQVVFSWNPAPGTALYLGYDEAGYWGSERASGAPQTGYGPHARALFVKLSWAHRQRLGRLEPELGDLPGVERGPAHPGAGAAH